MPEPTALPAPFVADTTVRTVELGLAITDAAIDDDAAVVFCNLLDDGRRHCPGRGAVGIYRDTVIRQVTDVPVVGHPLGLRVRVPRYRCGAIGCDREVFAHNTDRLARHGWGHEPAVRPLQTASADGRSGHRGGGGRRIRVAVGRREHHRHGRHPTDRGHRTTRLNGLRVIGGDEHRWSPPAAPATVGSTRSSST